MSEKKKLARFQVQTFFVNFYLKRPLDSESEIPPMVHDCVFDESVTECCYIFLVIVYVFLFIKREQIWRLYLSDVFFPF